MSWLSLSDSVRGECEEVVGGKEIKERISLSNNVQAHEASYHGLGSDMTVVYRRNVLSF